MAAKANIFTTFKAIKSQFFDNFTVVKLVKHQ
jgi:hypothetical protein